MYIVYLYWRLVILDTDFTNLNSPKKRVPLQENRAVDLVIVKGEERATKFPLPIKYLQQHLLLPFQYFHFVPIEWSQN